MYDIKLKQLQEEKLDLSNKLLNLKTEVRDWKKDADIMQNEYRMAIDDRDQTLSRLKDDMRRKEEMIREGEEKLKKAQQFIAEKENMLNEQSARLSECNEKDMSLHNILKEREDRIKELMKYRQDLCGKLDELNAICINLKKELSDKVRELNHKQEIIEDIQSEVRIRDRELHVKDAELEEKAEQLYEVETLLSGKDREIAKLRADIVDLRNHVFELKEENIRIEYAYNMGQSEGIPTRNSYMAGSSNLSWADKQDIKEVNKYGHSSRGERRSASTIRKGEMQTRESVKGRPSDINENEVTIKQLKEENIQLVNENNDLFDKLNRLNELLSHNKELEREIEELKNGQAMKDGNNMDSFDRSMVNVDGTKDNVNSITNCFDNVYIEKCLQSNDDTQLEKEALRQLKDKTKDGAAAQYIEKYKAKTKKIFQKRVKELELLLRFIDHKIKGYHFHRSSYVVNSLVEPSTLSPEEIKTMAKLTFLVENLLEKNLNLKDFVDDSIKRIEIFYTKTYNLSVQLGKMLKTLLFNQNEHIHEGMPGYSDIMLELEALSRVQVPEPIENFNQIETVLQDANSSRLEFFNLFINIEPKMNNIVDFVLKNVKQSTQKKADSFSFAAKAEDYLTSKVEKIREVEDLYDKLREIIMKNRGSLVSLPEHVQGYLQTYNNICEAIMNEVKPILNFTSNVLTENSSHHEMHPSSQTVYKGPALSEIKTSNILHSNQNKTSGQKPQNSAKKEIQNLNLGSTNQFNVDLTNRRLKFSANKSPQKEKQLFRSKPNAFTPSKYEEGGHLTSVQSENIGNKENGGVGGIPQGLSLSDIEESNQKLRTSRY